MAFPDYLLVVRVTVAAEVEAAWNRWYNEVHLPEITDCPGFVSSQRYVAQTGDNRTYVTLYALEGPEAPDSAQFSKRRGWAEFAPHVHATVELYTAITEGRQP